MGLWRRGEQEGDDGGGRTARQWRLTSQLVLALRPTLEPLDLARMVAETLPKIVPFASITIWISTARDGALALAAASGLSPDDERRLAESRPSWTQANALLVPERAVLADQVYHLPVTLLPLAAIFTHTRDALIPAAFSRHETLVAPLRQASGSLPVGLITLDGLNDPAAWQGEGRVLICEILAMVAAALASALVDAWAWRHASAVQQAIESGATEMLRHMEQARRGNFTARAPISTTFLGAIADLFNEMLAFINSTLVQARTSGRAVIEHAGTVNTLTSASIVNADIQANLIARATNAISDIAAAMQAIATQSEEAARVAASAREIGRDGRQSIEGAALGMQQVRDSTLLIMQRMKRLAESLQEIEDLVRASAQFAERITTLSLNAGIAVQHAGESGRGFAVIAQDLADLASAASDATSQLSARVVALQTQASQVVSAVAEGTESVVLQHDHMIAAGAAFEAIDEQSEQIAALNTTIFELAREEAGVTAALEASMTSISQITEATRDSVRQIGDAMTALESLAASLDVQIAQFTLDDRTADRS
jgi:twitching motility protein PilJ